jgi:hypothetical protein
VLLVFGQSERDVQGHGQQLADHLGEMIGKQTVQGFPKRLLSGH